MGTSTSTSTSSRSFGEHNTKIGGAGSEVANESVQKQTAQGKLRVKNSKTRKVPRALSKATVDQK